MYMRRILHHFERANRHFFYIIETDLNMTVKLMFTESTLACYTQAIKQSPRELILN